MALNSVQHNLGYGFNNSLQNLSPLPILAKREPSDSDVAEFGQYWIYADQVWMFTSAKTWTQLAAQGNEGVFTSLTVNGDSQFNGAILANTADNSIVLNSGTGDIEIGNDAFAKDITIGNVTGSSSLTLYSGTGGIFIDADSTGNITLNGAYQTVAPGTYAFTQNAMVGATSIVVINDIAVNASISIVMTNSYLTTLTTPIICSVTSSTAGTSGGQLQVNGMVIGSDTLTISLTNVGSATISSAVSNIVVSYIILGNV